ncbi:MAG TPA: right-handed parallel beta-helix repeat-containing protein [Candidatus Bathyarchaeia archaeon]|nr:right-handed parallel beta-helix repeat-containing protein [Candidatus Bathyarchaeia archaeon]
MERKKKTSLVAMLIISLVVTASGSAIYLGLWFRPIKIIDITNDRDFSRKYHFPGKGTKENPYIIEGYELSGNSHHNIRIQGVTKSFIIRNCLLEGSNKGIHLENSDIELAIVENNTLRDNEFGILVDACSNLQIRNNYLENNTKGIESIYNSNVFFEQNIVNNNYWGMNLESVDNIRIQNNSFSDCTYGICVDYSDLVSIERNIFIKSSGTISAKHNERIKIHNNTVVDCDYGFNVAYSQDVVYSKNNFAKTENCIWAGLSNNVIIDQNTCNLSISKAIYVANCANSQVKNNTVITTYGNGLYVWYCYKLVVTNNTCYNNTIGMSIICAEQVEVTQNTFEHNLEYGLVIQGVNATIWKNNFIDNDYTNITTIHSQANVAGNCTNYVGFPQFYNNDTLEGNYWSELEWYAGVEYIIDPGTFKDIYPLEEPIVVTCKTE